jgi:hypothetical protein
VKTRVRSLLGSCGALVAPGVAMIAVLAIALFAAPAFAVPAKKPAAKPAPKAGKKPAAKPAPAPTPAPKQLPDDETPLAAAPASPPAPAPKPLPPPPAPSPPVKPPGATAPSAPPPPPKLAMRNKSSHGGLVEDMDCSGCHTTGGWKLAATAGASGFDHDRTGFPLRGAHFQAQCSGCHANTPRPPNNCEGCHKDIHQGRMDGACAECHQATTWSDTQALEQHRRTRMPLTGKHAVIECSACHKRSGERQWSDLPVDCFGCHHNDYDHKAHPAHNGSTGNAPFPRDCTMCHRTSAWTPALTPASVGARIVSPVEHDPSFVLSSGPHRTAECASCHVDQRRMQAVRCDGCHTSTTLRDQHRRGGMLVAPTAATACLRCHPAGARR